MEVRRRDTDEILDVAIGTLPSEVLGISAGSSSSAVAAVVDNEVISLNDPLTEEVTVEPVELATRAGIRVYRRSLSLLMELVARHRFPDRRIVIGPTVGHAFWYSFDDGEGGESTAEALETEMKKWVAQDYPIVPGRLSRRHALEYFRSDGKKPETVNLLDGLNDRVVRVWECRGLMSLRHGPVAPSTGRLPAFSVEAYKNGFLLRYPPSATPLSMGPRDDVPIIYEVFGEHKQWGRILGVNSVGRLNNLALDRKKAREFMQVAEALHERKIAQLAEEIASSRGDIKAVLIAGPSSSGKTTFTKRLALSLRAAGIRPELIGLDDYYREKADIPLDENGEKDFETLEALDVPLFNANLRDLFAGKEATIPIFDFHKKGGRLEKGRSLTLGEEGVLLVEGIHGLNPALTPEVETGGVFRIYISALTQLNLDDHARISTTDNRLLRRIVRDHQFRRFETVNTLKMWPSVRRGEEKHIFPHQGTANGVFNSALDYELAILKSFAEPLLRTVKPDDVEFDEACRLLDFLKNFSPLPPEEVPELSILREFIGRSGFKY